jgi:hypothetical protein
MTYEKAPNLANQFSVINLHLCSWFELPKYSQLNDFVHSLGCSGLLSKKIQSTINNFWYLLLILIYIYCSRASPAVFLKKNKFWYGTLLLFLPSICFMPHWKKKFNGVVGHRVQMSTCEQWNQDHLPSNIPVHSLQLQRNQLPSCSIHFYGTIFFFIFMLFFLLHNSQ